MIRFLLAVCTPLLALEVAKMLPLPLAVVVYLLGWILAAWVLRPLCQSFLRVW